MSAREREAVAQANGQKDHMSAPSGLARGQAFCGEAAQGRTPVRPDGRVIKDGEAAQGRTPVRPDGRVIKDGEAAQAKVRKPFPHNLRPVEGHASVTDAVRALADGTRTAHQLAAALNTTPQTVRGIASRWSLPLAKRPPRVVVTRILVPLDSDTRRALAAMTDGFGQWLGGAETLAARLLTVLAREPVLVANLLDEQS